MGDDLDPMQHRWSPLCFGRSNPYLNRFHQLLNEWWQNQFQKLLLMVWIKNRVICWRPYLNDKKNFSHFFSPCSNEVHWNWRLLNTISRKYSWNWCGSWESFWEDEGERSKTKFRYCRTADDSIIVLITPSLVLRDQIMFTSEPLAEFPVQKIFPHDIWWFFDASLLRY